MNRLLGKSLTKGLQVIGEATRNLTHRAYYSLSWSLGPGVHFAGPIHRRALAGDVAIGARCYLGPNICIDAVRGARIRIGRDCSVNAGTFICAHQSIDIGDMVRIGEYCGIHDSDHEWRDPSRTILDQGFRTAPITIGNDVWIGRGATIAKGVTIGNGAVIGANAFVNRDVAPAESVAGVPARPIGRRDDL